MKKNTITLMIFIGTLFFTLSSSAVTLINNNSYRIKYQILHETCTVQYDKGKIPPHQQITWEGNREVKPGTVCIYARGKTSTIGTYCGGIPTKGSVVEITNSGPGLGISCECTSGC